MSQLTWLPPLNSHKNFHIRVHAVQGDRLQFNPGSSSTLPESRLHVDVLFHDGESRKTLYGLSTIEDFETFQSLPSTSAANTACDNLLNHPYVSLPLPFQLDEAYYRETRLFPKKQESYTTLVTKDVLIERLYDFLKHLVTDPLNAGFEKVRSDLFIEKWILLPRVELDTYIARYEDQDKKVYEKAISRPRKESELKEAALWYETYKEAISRLKTDCELSEEDFCRAFVESLKQASASTSSVLDDLGGIANLISSSLSSYLSSFFKKAKKD